MDLTEKEKARKKVRRDITTLSYDLDGKIDDAINYLKSLKDRHKDMDGLHIHTSEYADYGECCASRRIQLCYWGDETDYEYNKRIEQLKVTKELSERYERQNYERLKQKYG